MSTQMNSRVQVGLLAIVCCLGVTVHAEEPPVLSICDESTESVCLTFSQSEIAHVWIRDSMPPSEFKKTEMGRATKELSRRFPTAQVGDPPPELIVKVSPSRRQGLHEFTEHRIGQAVALAINGKVIATPQIRSPLDSSFAIASISNQEELEALATALSPSWKRVPWNAVLDSE